MKISSKADFNALSKCLQYALLSFGRGCHIKDSRSKELLAHCQHYKTANGLLHSLPVTFSKSEQAVTLLINELRSKHQYKIANPAQFFDKIMALYSQYLLATNYVSPFVVDLTYINDCDDAPLVSEGKGVLEKGLPFLYVVISQRIIFPKIETELISLDKPSVERGLVLRYPLPCSVSRTVLLNILVSEDVGKHLSEIEAGFSATTDEKGLSLGHLTEKAQAAEVELKQYLIQRLGKAESPRIKL